MTATSIALLILQAALYLVAVRVTSRAVGFLPLCMFVLFFILTGSVKLEQESEAGYPASIFLVLFSVCLIGGATVSRAYNRFQATRNHTRNGRCFTAERAGPAYAVTAVTLCGFVLIALVFFMRQGVPLLAADPALARTQSQIGSALYYRVFLYALPFLSVLPIGNWYLNRQRRFLTLGVGAVALTSMILTLLGFKGYTLWYVIWVAMFTALYGRNTRESWVKLGVLGVLGIGAGSYVSGVLYGGDVLAGMQFLFDRATRIASTGYVTLVHEYIPSRDPAKPIPPNFPNYFALWMLGRDSIIYQNDLEITLTAPGGALLYVGKEAALFLGVAVGAVGQFMTDTATRYRLTPVLAMAFVYISYLALGWIVRGYVTSYFILPLSSLIVFVLCYMLAEMLVARSATFRIYYEAW